MQVPRWSNHARQVPAARPRPAGLARQVAHGDRSALVGLHDALAPDVLRTIRRRLPDAAESMSVLRATFVEVWRMARYHTNDGAVRGWVTGVADRRAAERVCGSTNVDAAYEAQNNLEFNKLLSLRPDRDLTGG